MSRRGRAGCIIRLSLIAYGIAFLIDRENTSKDLTILAAGIVLGELFVLRLEDRSSVPLSYAVFFVLASAFAADEYAVVVIGAELVAFYAVGAASEPSGRLRVMCNRLVVAAATLGAYRGVYSLLDQDPTVRDVMIALAVAAVAQVFADSLFRSFTGRRFLLTRRGALAWLAVTSSGMLMAICYGGVDGKGNFGLWGPILFATPLFAAWYAFERLDSATLAYRQTIEALAMSPELGGLVPPGHAERVAALAVSM